MKMSSQQETLEAPPSSTAQATFTLFPDLPKELRLIIWSYVIDEPRVIEVDWQQCKWHPLNPERTRFPNICFVCRESHEEAKKICNKLHSCEQNAWINFSIDTLYYRVKPQPYPNRLDIKHILWLVSLERLRFLALQTDLWKVILFTGWAPWLFQSLPNLEELILVCEDRGYKKRWTQPRELTLVELSTEGKEDEMLWLDDEHFEQVAHFEKSPPADFLPLRPIFKLQAVGTHRC
jgi:hypothetical protein